MSSLASNSCGYDMGGYDDSHDQGYNKLSNVDPKRRVLKRMVDVCGISGFGLVFDDEYYANYITPSTVDILGYLQHQNVIHISWKVMRLLNV